MLATVPSSTRNSLCYGPTSLTGFIGQWIFAECCCYIVSTLLHSDLWVSNSPNSNKEQSLVTNTYLLTEHVLSCISEALHLHSDLLWSATSTFGTPFVGYIMSDLRSGDTTLLLQYDSAVGEFVTVAMVVFSSVTFDELWCMAHWLSSGYLDASALHTIASSSFHTLHNNRPYNGRILSLNLPFACLMHSSLNSLSRWSDGSNIPSGIRLRVSSPICTRVTFDSRGVHPFRMVIHRNEFTDLILTPTHSITLPSKDVRGFDVMTTTSGLFSGTDTLALAKLILESVCGILDDKTDVYDHLQVSSLVDSPILHHRVFLVMDPERHFTQSTPWPLSAFNRYIFILPTRGSLSVTDFDYAISWPHVFVSPSDTVSLDLIVPAISVFAVLVCNTLEPYSCTHRTGHCHLCRANITVRSTSRSVFTIASITRHFVGFTSGYAPIWMLRYHCPEHCDYQYGSCGLLLFGHAFVSTVSWLQSILWWCTHIDLHHSILLTTRVFDRQHDYDDTGVASLACRWPSYGHGFSFTSVPTLRSSINCIRPHQASTAPHFTPGINASTTSAVTSWQLYSSHAFMVRLVRPVWYGRPHIMQQGHIFSLCLHLPTTTNVSATLQCLLLNNRPLVASDTIQIPVASAVLYGSQIMAAPDPLPSVFSAFLVASIRTCVDVGCLDMLVQATVDSVLARLVFDFDHSRVIHSVAFGMEVYVAYSTTFTLRHRAQSHASRGDVKSLTLLFCHVLGTDGVACGYDTADFGVPDIIRIHLVIATTPGIFAKLSFAVTPNTSLLANSVDLSIDLNATSISTIDASQSPVLFDSNAFWLDFGSTPKAVFLLAAHESVSNQVWLTRTDMDQISSTHMVSLIVVQIQPTTKSVDSFHWDLVHNGIVSGFFIGASSAPISASASDLALSSKTHTNTRMPIVFISSEWLGRLGFIQPQVGHTVYFICYRISGSIIRGVQHRLYCPVDTASAVEMVHFVRTVISTPTQYDLYTKIASPLLMWTLCSGQLRYHPSQMTSPTTQVFDHHVIPFEPMTCVFAASVSTILLSLTGFIPLAPRAIAHTNVDTRMLDHTSVRLWTRCTSYTSLILLRRRKRIGFMIASRLPLLLGLLTTNIIAWWESFSTYLGIATPWTMNIVLVTA